MDICATSSTSIGLRRVALKDLEPDLDSILIIAIIINKQTPRKFPDRNKENEQYRAVWNCTLRDSHRDYINLSFWGPSDEVCATNDKFYTADVVELRNPRINVRKFSEAGEQFTPMVTSPFYLTIFDDSQILHYKGDTFSFTKLLNFPTKPLSSYVPLRDIHHGGENMKERVIDILGAIKTVGPIKSIKTKTGLDMQVREIILFDHTSSGLRVTLWDTDHIMRAAKWKPRVTILFITDAKLVWSNFLNTYTASVTSRSIITENPIGQEAKDLANYAKTAPLETFAILDQFVTDLPDPESIQNVMCVQQVYSKINSSPHQSFATGPQITALMFVIITQLDLDGLLPVTRAKCSSCRNLLRNAPPKCENVDCPTVLGTAPASVDHCFDIEVHLSDHTGTLTNCRLSGTVAEQVLGCSIQQFIRMSDQQKSQLKWRFLMERCAVRIVVLVTSRLTPRISIVSCFKANPLETAQRIPLC